jgi:hypothetical protein
MYRPLLCEIWSSGDHVVARFGNVEVKTPYEDAFLISHWLIYRAREAKRFAGDCSHHFSAIGTMHDANAGDGPPDPGILTARDAPILKKSSWNIFTEGSEVVCKFGNSTMKIGYRNAIEFARWFRMMGKVAKRRAGDTSDHWSKIGIQHDIKYGPDITRG